MVELSLDKSGSTANIGYAGDTLNTAIYLKRSAPELDVCFVSRLGSDAFSDRLRNFIKTESIATDAIETSDDRSVGLYAITTDDSGERSFSYWRSNSAARQVFMGPEGADFSVLQGTRVAYLSAITLAILPDEMRLALFDWIDTFRSSGGQIAFDSNYRPSLWENGGIAQARVAAMWSRTDLAIPSVDDEMEIFRDTTPQGVLDRLKSFGVTDGALKCGATGPISLGDAVDQTYPEADRVVDTTAAGDSFSGGYLAARLTGQSQADALMAGHRLAAYVIGHKGAIAPML